MANEINRSTVWRHVSAGTTLAVTVLFCVGVGWWIDRHTSSGPWGTVVGAFIGIAAGLYHFIKEFLNDESTTIQKP